MNAKHRTRQRPASRMKIWLTLAKGEDVALPFASTAVQDGAAEPEVSSRGCCGSLVDGDASPPDSSAEEGLASSSPWRDLLALTALLRTSSLFLSS
eukprot:scaffold69790_cov58-Phaeocystis_antarctica.AAC.3